MGKFKLKQGTPLSFELKYSYEKQTKMPGQVNSASYINPSTNGPEEVTFSGKGNNPADKALNNPSEVETDLNPVQEARRKIKEDKQSIRAEGKFNRQTERATKINQRYFGDPASTPKENSVMQDQENQTTALGKNSVMQNQENQTIAEKITDIGIPMMEEKPNRAGRPVDSGIMYKTNDTTSPKSKSIKKMIEEDKFSNLASKNNLI